MDQCEEKSGLVVNEHVAILYSFALVVLLSNDVGWGLLWKWQYNVSNNVVLGK